MDNVYEPANQRRLEMVIIKEVLKGSIGQEIGINPGDDLLSIDGQPIEDILDYQFYSSDSEFLLSIKKPDGEQWDIDIEKDYDEDLGLVFDGVVFDRMKRCRNKCVFCFIDQLPPRMRSTLYTKDDDYRYSFLYGNFITLTNLTEKDWNKIINMHLSPLYVSVHSMDPEVRVRMLNNKKAAEIKNQLQRLKDADIKIHTQIVLCPGINDGDVLSDTIEQLAELVPSVLSIGIVPVGLTGHRSDLPDLRGFTADEIKAIILLIDQYQERFRKEYGYGLVYLADEFYISVGLPVPEEEYYDDFSQIENGIGLARILLDQFQIIEPDLPEEIEPRTAYLVTGYSALPVMNYIVDRLNRIKGLEAVVLPIPNRFFGGNVSVTGLLTGSDIIDYLGIRYKDKNVIIPEVVLKDGEDVLLDDISIKEISAKTGAKISTVDGSAQNLVDAILKGV
jgi:putative radical SAM enzyme (TIGR03279 family)